MTNFRKTRELWCNF